MKRILAICLGILFFQMNTTAQDYSSYELIERYKNIYGSNKWIFEPKTDKWGNTIQGEGSYTQIVEGVYSDFNGTKECLCMFQSSKSFLRDDSAYMGLFVFFEYFSPLITFDNSSKETVKIYAKKNGNNQAEANTEGVLTTTNSISSFALVFEDFQFSFHQTINQNPDFQAYYNSLICNSDKEYLEILVEGNNWKLRTKLYGDSPIWK